MQITTRVELEAKLLKYVRQQLNMQSHAYSVNDASMAKGFFFKDLMHKMWYFVRKNKISEQDVYKVARRLEHQGLIVLNVLDGRLYITPPAPSLQPPTNEEYEIMARDNRVNKWKPTSEQIEVAMAIARKHEADKERAKELEERRKTAQTVQSTTVQSTEPELSIEEDQSTLEDYLKD